MTRKEYDAIKEEIAEMRVRRVMNVKRAIEYFEYAVRQADEIIADCAADLEAELMEQKEHFIVALTALREKRDRYIRG